MAEEQEEEEESSFDRAVAAWYFQTLAPLAVRPIPGEQLSAYLARVGPVSGVQRERDRIQSEFERSEAQRLQLSPSVYRSLGQREQARAFREVPYLAPPPPQSSESMDALSIRATAARLAYGYDSKPVPDRGEILRARHAEPLNSPTPRHSSVADAITQIARRFSWIDLLVFLASEGVGVPLAIGGGEAATNELLRPTLIGFGFGLPLMALGFVFPFVKHRLPDAIRGGVARTSTIWLPVAILAAFIYVDGPEVYRRATLPSAQPTLSPLQIANIVTPMQDQITAGKQSLAERDKAIASLQSQLTTVQQQRDSLQQQLQSAQQQRPAVQSAVSAMGPITWNNEIGFSQTGDNSGIIFLAVVMSGKNTSPSAVPLKDAYIISELTGAKKTLKVNIGINNLISIADVNQIPPGAPVDLWATFDSGINAIDFLSQWGKFSFHAEYGDTKYDKLFDENFVTNRVAQFPTAHIGPHVTKKSPGQ